jgi:hypothetical protein
MYKSKSVKKLYDGPIEKGILDRPPSPLKESDDENEDEEEVDNDDEESLQEVSAEINDCVSENSDDREDDVSCLDSAPKKAKVSIASTSKTIVS